MRATLYKELSNKQTPIELPEGNTIKEALPDLDLDNAIIVINGRIEKPEYRLKENDIITIRLTPSGMTALVVTSIAFGAAALVVGIYGGVKAYQAKKAAEKAQEELEKIKKLTNKSDIDNRPFLRGASNTLATGNSQPYIIGRHFFTPYLLCSPFYKITGTDGANQYTYTTLECGFNKQILQTVAIDDIIIKKFNDSTPQEGAYSIDAGIFAEDGKIEIAQDGALLTDLPALNYKTESTACNDEIPHDSDVEAGTQEYLTYTLNPYAKDVDIAIMFPYGLYAYNDDNDKIETQLNITPQFSLDGGNTWQSFTFNNNGTQTTLFKRKVSDKELRFVAHKDFTKADYNTLEANGQKAIYIRVRSNGNKDSMIKNDCYVLYYQSVCFDPDKSTSELIPCKVVEDRERAYCTVLGLKLKATKINEDKLKKINIISHGVARTWNGTAWSSTKSATRNPASWALEVLTSDSHPASKFNDSEIDLDSFGDYYDYCENPENDPAEEHFKYQFDWVITQNTKKDDVLNYILDATGAVIYTDIYGRRAIAIDRPQENALAVYNPQNIISIQNKKSFGRRTDGLRIKWVNCDDDLYQEDTYLLMSEGQTLNQDSIIRDITVTGITTFDHVVKYARRLMAIEALRPKTTNIEVGNEGIFFTPFSKILIQDDSLKIGIGKGFVIQDISYSGTAIYKILIDGKVTFEEGKHYGIIVQCYGASGATPLPLKVSGIGTTDTLQVDTYVTTSSDVFPERGCIFSFGELDENGEFTKVTTEYLINQITRSDKGFNLELVNYNEAIYDTGTIPEYKSNITQKVTEAPAEIPADYVTKRELDEVIDDLQTGNLPVGKPDTPTLVRGTAERDGITLSCAHNTDGLRNDLRAIVFTLTKADGSTETVSVSGRTGVYYFDRIIDGYPEAAELAQWSVTAKAVSIYGKESEESEVQPVSADTYGTWKVLPPDVYAQSANRAANVTWQRKDKTPLGKDIYGVSFYDIQISKDGTNWYKPAQGKTGKVSEDDWKDGAGFLRLSGGSWSQSLPLYNQTINLPENTTYYYRVRTRGITDDYLSAWSDPVTAIALATGTGDIIAKAVKEAQLGDSSVSNIKIKDGSIVASEKVVSNSITTELLNVLAKNKINNFSITGTLEGWSTGGTLEDDASGFKKLRFTNSGFLSNVFTVQPNEICSFEFGIACPNYTSLSGAFIGLTRSQNFKEYQWSFVTNKWTAGTVSNFYSYFIQNYKATTVEYFKTYILGSNVSINDIPAPSATDTAYTIYAQQLQGTDTTARLRTGFNAITAGTYWELYLPQVYSGQGGRIVAQQIITPALSAINANVGVITSGILRADIKAGESKPNVFLDLNTEEFRVGNKPSLEDSNHEDAEYLHWKPNQGLFLKLKNLIVDAIASTIRGRFRVRGNTAEMAQSVLIVNPESTVDPDTNTPANTTDIKTALRCPAGITGNVTGNLTGNADTATEIKPLGNSITLPATQTSITKIIKIATLDHIYTGTFNIKCLGGNTRDIIKGVINGAPVSESGVRVVYGKNRVEHGIKKIVVTADTSDWNSKRQIYAEVLTYPNYSYSQTITFGVVETNDGTFTPSMTEVSSVEGTVLDSLPLDYQRGDISSYQHVFTKDIIGSLAGNADTATLASTATFATTANVRVSLRHGTTWFSKTWGGFTGFWGANVWTDGENIYYSFGSSAQYVLNKATSTWSSKTWTGLTDLRVEDIWTDGENIYYSDGTIHRVLNKTTSTWSSKTWTGLTDFVGRYTWTDGENIYYSDGTSKQYVLNKATSTWSSKTWNGLTDFNGNNVWTDGENIYYSDGTSKQYVLNKATSTWSSKTWTGLTDFVGRYTWTDGENIYYSDGTSKQYVLNKATSTWSSKTWNGLTNFNGNNVWTDGENIYYTSGVGPKNYVLPATRHNYVDENKYQGLFKTSTSCNLKTLSKEFVFSNEAI